MSAEARTPDTADEEFLDRVFERILASFENGSDPTPDDLLEGREHLRPEVEGLLRTARHVAVLRPRTMPRVAGFTLLHEIGRGGMGAVYLARQETLGGRRVALKVLPSSAGLSARARERFLSEARVIAELRHPNVITVHDVVASGGVHAYAMEWVDGASLGELIEFLKAKGASPEEPEEIGQREAVRPGPDLAQVREFLGRTGTGPPDSYPIFISRIGVAIARALAALHRSGLVHRDVKPSNILLRPDGTPLLSDFGLVHAADGAMTQSGQFAGTIAYASPEQLGGDPESLDARSDVYALGVTLYHALTLHLPFDDLRDRTRRGRTPAGMLRLIESARAAPLRAWNRRLPRDLETIVGKATDPDPARRYPTADELADDLERMLALQPIHARPAGLLARGTKFLRRNGAVALGIAAGSVVSLALAAAAVVYIVLVPRWVDHHVREARLSLLDPGQANAIFNSELWGLPYRPNEARSGSVLHGGIDEALREYDAALRWVPLDDDLREECDTVLAFRSASGGTAGQGTGSRTSTSASRSKRCEGLSAFLAGDVDTALEVWSRWEALRDPRAEPDPFVEATLGILYLVREEPARAYPRLREACQAFPNVAFLTTYLADAALQCGDLDAAEQLLIAAVGMPRLDPLGAQERVRAELLAARGRDTEAEAIYRSAGPHTPTGLHYARFLESRGRSEEAVDQYFRVASGLRGRQVQREYAAALERWWTSLSGAERLRRIRMALDEDPLGSHSLIARLRLLAPRGSAAPKARPGDLRLPATIRDGSSSPSLQYVALPNLRDVLEVENMARWSEITKYPRPRKVLQFWAWCWPRTQAALEMIFRLHRVYARPAACGLLIGGLAAPISAQVTQRVSLDSGGIQGNGESQFPSISADGRWMAFGSAASNLVSGDTNGSRDTFVRDRLTGTTERVSVDSSEVQGNDVSDPDSISADGRYVSIDSLASNLVPGDTNGTVDVFVRDRQSGTTEMVSVDSGEVQGNFFSTYSSISADGRYVAFHSFATNLVSGDTNASLDIFVRDRLTGTTERVSVDSSGVQGNGFSVHPLISADGRYVAFQSDATNLVPGDTNGSLDSFIRDRLTGTTERVSVDSGGVQGNGSSSSPSISPDGRYVAFESDATNLVPGDTNGSRDTFVRDRLTGTTERVSVDSGGVQGNGGSVVATGSDPRISADGRYVAFHSDATNLVPADTNAATDVFLRDRQNGTTKRVSIDSGGVQGNGHSISSHAPPSVSADGRYVMFTSTATNLVPGDTNGFVDVFVHDHNAAGFTSLCDPNVGSVIACPCSNPPSGLGRGCNNSAATGGAILSASGVAYLSIDSLVFTTSGERPTALSILTQWTGGSSTGAIYGMGVRCTSGPFKRLYTKSASGGSITAPNFGAGDPTVSARSAALGNVILAGESRWYFVYYRDPNVLGGCPALSTFNATQTGRVNWSL